MYYYMMKILEKHITQLKKNLKRLRQNRKETRNTKNLDLKYCLNNKIRENRKEIKIHCFDNYITQLFILVESSSILLVKGL